MKLQRMKTKKIAIIGKGASGRAIFYHLAKIISSNTKKYSNIQIDVYDPRENSGVAYSTDIESHILNMNLSSMTIEPDDTSHFNSFIQSNPEVLVNYSEYLDNYNDGNPPRKLIRQYLDFVMKEALALEKLHPSFSTTFFNKEVENITRHGNQYHVHTNNGVAEYDHIVLSIGNLEPKDHYKDLVGHERYFSNPWPFSRLLDGIGSSLTNDKTVIGVLGSSLTAIDIAVGLKEKDYKGKVLFFSRSGLLPSIQSPRRSYYESKLKHLSHSNKSSIKLEEVINLIKSELQEVERKRIDFNSIFNERYVRSARENLEHDIRGANLDGFKYQDYFFNISKYLPAIWERIDIDDKLNFLANNMSLWSTYRSAMPLQNAKRINSLIQSGELQIHKIAKDRKSITITDRAISVKNSENEILECDYTINATGTSLDTKSTKNRLLKNLIQNDLIDHHPAGGLHINPRTFEVLNSKGNVSNNLFLIGSLTRGNLFYTNAYEANVSQAKNLSKIISNLIIKKDESR